MPQMSSSQDISNLEHFVTENYLLDLIVTNIFLKIASNYYCMSL